MHPDNRRRFVIAIVCVIFGVYIIQLFNLQVLNPNYKIWADNIAFLNKTIYPSRGMMYDRNGELLVNNRHSYDVKLILREMQPFDTSAFCGAIDILREDFDDRLTMIKDKKRNPNYSSYTAQSFVNQLGNKEYGVLQESIYKFPGFYIESHSMRDYNLPYGAHIFGYVAEVDKKIISKDNSYKKGDIVGKTGVERAYEDFIRGRKGMERLLRDVHGRIKGKYEQGIHDISPVSGRDLTLSIDIKLQAYGEELMRNKLGSIIMIEPKTGEILCLVSSPTYNPNLLVGQQFSQSYSELVENPYLPLLNRALNGTYSPGSAFKMAQGLAFLQEDIITLNTAYSCFKGWPPRGGHPACHAHNSPLTLVSAIETSCNSYFCWGLEAMLTNKKYPSIGIAMDKWRDRMVAQGFGYSLGVDMPSEKHGMIPNSQYYNKKYGGKWNAFTIISIAIGQGEVALSPIQICNLAATIANRGYFYTPHVIKSIKDVPLDSSYVTPRYTGIKPEYYEPIIEGMRRAVVKGTCRGANISDIVVCGKTGTVQNSAKDHSVFIGFAPMEDPKVAIMVFIENGGFGATYAVPTARLMIEKYLKQEIPEQDKLIENNLKNTTILRNVVQKN